MPNDFNIKNLESSNHAFQQRVFQLIVIVLLLTLFLIGRLFYLQIIKHNYYMTMSSNNSINLVPIAPPRGLIYDRTGKILAENMPVYSLEIRPDEVSDLPETIAKLHKFIKLSPEDIRLFYRQVKENRPFDNVPLKIKLTDDEVAQFYVNQYNFPGVKIAARLMRYYPYKNDMVTFLGYTGRINQEELATVDASNYSGTNYIGKLALERYFESQLHGTVGFQQVEVDVNGRAIRTLNDKPAIPGDSLYLTIDADLQEAAVAAMQGHRGSLVALDPRNGQILAMVSAPTYDPNIFVRGISKDDYQILRKSPDQPLFNRTIRAQYPPGSTVKPIYALQGLKTGTVTPEFSVYDPGFYQLPGLQHKYRDMHIHGWVNLVKAIYVSCDTYFYRLADKMGIANLDEVLEEFGFGKPTGIEMKEELSGLVPSPEWRMKKKGERWYKGETLITGIGQGSLLVTPIQLAVMVSIIANRGVHYKPTLILQSAKADGTIVPNKPVVEEPVQFAPEVWDTVLQGMIGVIRADGGTAVYRFGQPKYSAAGKTGTAQLFSIKQNQKYSEMKVAKNLRDNSLFIVFAPVENPKIAMAVVIQNDHAAASIARKIVDYYLITEKHLNDAPTTASTTAQVAPSVVSTPAMPAPVATTNTPATTTQMEAANGD